MTDGVVRIAVRGRLAPIATALVIELGAAWLLVAHDRVIAAIILHLVASGLCASTIDASSPTYRDALFVGALAVPVLGPLFGWFLLARPRTGSINAHEFFASYEADVHAEIELQGGAHESRRRTMSFHEVLRHGSLDHRRNALRKLAQRGQRMHMELLRRCLSHPDMELRLGAFTELNRLLRGWEERIGELHVAVAEDPRDHCRRADVARAHREYAASGLLDEDMARYQLQKAAAACELPIEPASRAADLAVERAMVFAELGDLEGAARALQQVGDSSREEPRVCIARARVAFLTRRFGDVEREVHSLEANAAEVPRWMREFSQSSPELAEAAR